MRIAFLGTPDISAYVLDELVKFGVEIAWVATQPDRPCGRGLCVEHSPVKDRALYFGIPVLQTEKFDRDFFEEIKKHGEIDLAVIIAYGLYLPTYFISYPRHECLNIHVSLLPKYRGASPVASAIMNGDAVTGVTIMKVVKEMDAGDIVAQIEEPILVDDNTETLEWKLVRKGTELLKNILHKYVRGETRSTPQSETGITPVFTNKIKRTDAAIDWNWDAIKIHNMVRAMFPWPGVEVKFGDKKLKLARTRPMVSSENIGPGCIKIIDGMDVFAVGTGKDWLLVEKIQPSGKKEMTARDFINGYRIKNGMRFE